MNDPIKNHKKIIIKRKEEKYMKYKIFVYGTLMSGMNNHHYLENSKYLGNCEIEGYEMYHLRYYPGIIEGKGRIKGEVYEIDEETLHLIDFLEGEGSLYIRKEIETEYGITYIYVYNKCIDNCNKIPYEMQPYNDLVYYVCYGSNMLEERFLYYIKGGLNKYNNNEQTGCINSNNPIESIPILIPYNMYYSKYSSKWNGAVSFLSLEKEGMSYGKAYLITREQYEHVKKYEGNWYSKEVELPRIKGIRTVTFTNEDELKHKGISEVNESYINVLIKGLKSTFNNLSENDIKKYLNDCGKEGGR